MRRCKICILPSSYSAVTFDEDGVCSLCRAHQADAEKERRQQQTKRRELEAIVAQTRDDGGPYDCVVPMSGGRDSSYAAYVMVRQFGLRAIAVNFDNGYRSKCAVGNLETVTGALEMPLVTLRPQPDLIRGVFRHFFKMTGYFCSACDAIGYIIVGSFLTREARRLGRTVLAVGGWSKKYEYQPGLSVLSMKFFDDILRRDEQLHLALREHPLVEPDVFQAFTSVDDIRQALPKRPGDSTGQNGGVRVIQLPDFVDWDYRVLGTTLKRELGWEEPGFSHGAHFDCRLAGIPEYLKHHRFGLSQETIRNSVLVREGRMTREEALQKMRLEHTTEPPALVDALAEWGMTVDEIAWDAEWTREKAHR